MDRLVELAYRKQLVTPPTPLPNWKLLIYFMMSNNMNHNDTSRGKMDVVCVCKGEKIIERMKDTRVGWGSIF